MSTQRQNDRAESADLETLPAYEKPEMQVMTEDELLVAFQVTQAGVTWWVM